MNHRHLYPDEIELLLDGEAGFGVAPLRAHAESCATCRAELDDAAAVTAALDRLPRFAPAPMFAERVMSRVHVFQPWHVAAADSVRRLVPASPAARLLAGIAAGSAGTVMALAAIWVVARFDLIMFFLSDVVVERTRVAALSGAGSAITDLFGATAFEALRAGGVAAISMVLSAIVATALVTAVALRAVAVASGRRRG
ncbi:MAG: hypothetical protein ACRENI_13305 [Gemmatimonadaceae bacterium]